MHKLYIIIGFILFPYLNIMYFDHMCLPLLLSPSPNPVIPLLFPTLDYLSKMNSEPREALQAVLALYLRSSKVLNLG